MKVVEYTTVCEEHPNALDSKVNVLLAKGWELYGDPYSVHDGSGSEQGFDGFLCQALVRKEE